MARMKVRSFARGGVVAALAAWSMVGLADGDWPESLWLGRGGFWEKRVGVTVANPSEKAVEGETVAIRVGTGKGELPLVGVRVEELRLVDSRGVELLYGVWTADGVRLESGAIPAEATVSLPFCAAAKACESYRFYFDNPSAWALADFLNDNGRRDWNGGFEQGVRQPSGWVLGGTDGTHVLSWDSAVKASGRRSVKAVASGERSWFSCARHEVPVVPGSTITLRVKVRAQGVKGDAGWYVHVGDDKNPMRVNKVIPCGGGTFDWRPLTYTLKVPEGCTRLATGSALWGTGTAWYDDFSFETDAPAVEPTVTVGAVETLAMRRLGESDAWRPVQEGWEFRVPVRLANFSGEPRGSTLAAIRLREAVRGVRNAEWKVFADGRELACCRMGETLLVPCEVPPRTIRTCWMYVKSGAVRPPAKREAVRSALGSVIPSDQVLVTSARVEDEAAYARLVGSSVNLVRNPCFTDGEAGWTHTKERKGSGVSYEVVKAGGKFGGGFAKAAIPAKDGGDWRGWYQTVRVKPGRSYFFGGFMSGDDVTGNVHIHAHAHARDGRTTLMMSTVEALCGTSPWMPSFGLYTAGHDDASFTLHLTTNGDGTLAYDGILMTEYVRAAVGELEMRPAAATGGLAVQAVDPIVKVFRETAVKDSRETFAVSLARNETEPLQLAVRSPQAMGDLTVEVQPPTPAGVAVETGVVGYVPVDYPTAYYSSTTPKWELKHPMRGPASDGWSGWWPDPILPTNACELAANATRAVWINFRTAAATKPGEYRGRIVWKSGGRVVREDGYVVKVWNFALPAVAETPAIYDLRIGGRWEADFKGVSADERRRAFWRFFSEKRICPDSLGGSLKVAHGKDGRVKIDFAEYDRLATEYFEEFKFPMSYTPSVFYCFGWAMPPRGILGENPYEGEWPYAGADRTKLRPAYRKAYQEALRLYWDHVKAKGWADRIVLYISDEPHFFHKDVKDQMVALCEMIHEVDPAIRIYSSTWQHCPEWNDSLDVWGVAHYGGFPVAEMKARAAAGKHVWFTTDGQMCLDTPYCAVERLLPHYCIAYDSEAYEFWGATWLTYDPWRYGWHSYIPQSDTPGKSYFVRYPDGDGYLCYPGVPGRFKGPVTSVRLEAARDGVEDFSYLKALRRLADGTGDRAAKAKALLADFAALVTIPNAGGRYSTRILPEPERIGVLRLRAGELLSE